MRDQIGESRGTIYMCIPENLWSKCYQLHSTATTELNGQNEGDPLVTSLSCLYALESSKNHQNEIHMQ